MIIRKGNGKIIEVAQTDLSPLYLFDVYQTRADYREAHGVDPPPFDPTRPPQHWYDPDAAKRPGRVVMYERVLAMDERGQPLLGPAGRPYLEPLVLPRMDAATVNIPYKEAANEPGTDQPTVPVPLRALYEDEELALGWAGIVVLRRRSLWQQSISAPTAWTEDDRRVLMAIAAKLGVQV